MDKGQLHSGSVRQWWRQDRVIFVSNADIHSMLRYISLPSRGTCKFLFSRCSSRTHSWLFSLFLLHQLNVIGLIIVLWKTSSNILQGSIRPRFCRPVSFPSPGVPKILKSLSVTTTRAVFTSEIYLKILAILLFALKSSSTWNQDINQLYIKAWFPLFIRELFVYHRVVFMFWFQTTGLQHLVGGAAVLLVTANISACVCCFLYWLCKSIAWKLFTANTLRLVIPLCSQSTSASFIINSQRQVCKNNPLSSNTQLFFILNVLFDL